MNFKSVTEKAKFYSSAAIAVGALGIIAVMAFFIGLGRDEGLTQLERLARLAESTTAQTESQSEVVYGPMPDIISNSEFKPLRKDFGYDPGLASKVYGRDLRFENLDPLGFPNTDLGNAARDGLGHILTHGTSDISLPLWTAALTGGSLANADKKFVELGYLPSPFRVQLNANARLNLSATDRFGTKSEYTIDAPAPMSLNQSAYRKNDQSTGGDELNEYLSGNCFSCHAGVYGNIVVAGAPNKNYNPEWASRDHESETLDEFARLWKSDRPSAKELLVANHLLKEMGIDTSAEVRVEVDDYEANHLVNFIRYSSNVPRKIMNPASNETIGSHSASFVTLGKFAHLKQGAKDFDDWESPDVAWGPGSTFQKFLDKFKTEHGAEFAVTHSQPWWLARYRGMHFWNNMVKSGVDESAAGLATFLMDPDHGNLHSPRWPERYEISRRIQSYIELTQSPTFPERIDYPKADRGMQLYNSNCSDCHGEIKLDQRIGDQLTSIDESTRFVLDYDPVDAKTLYDDVGTDRLYWQHMALARNVFENLSAIPDAKEYRMEVASPNPDEEPSINAPPLIGLWASAPYFHNGSVPNVFLVLNSEKRPDCWKMDADPCAYDYQNMGVEFENSESLAEKKVPLDWLIYDTSHSENGMTNGGHDFGDHLTDSERFEIIEFLKILETRRVRPNVMND